MRGGEKAHATPVQWYESFDCSCFWFVVHVSTFQSVLAYGLSPLRPLEPNPHPKRRHLSLARNGQPREQYIASLLKAWVIRQPGWGNLSLFARPGLSVSRYYSTIRALKMMGGWPRLNSEKGLWVAYTLWVFAPPPHPAAFAG